MRGSALGATLHYKNVTYLLIKHTQEFEFPHGECADVDVTAHNDTEKTFEPGIIDGGTITVPIVWDGAETSHAWLMTNRHTTKQFKYTPKDGVAVEFLARIKSISARNPVGTGPKLRNLTLKVTGGTLT